MLESIPFSVFLGSIFGFLAGLGIGGGSLLVLWLTVVLGMEPDTARSINLLFFIPTALIACFFRKMQKDLDIKTVLPAMVTGCLAAALFSWLGTQIQTDLLKKLFGGLLILTGLREVLYKKTHPPA